MQIGVAPVQAGVQAEAQAALQTAAPSTEVPQAPPAEQVPPVHFGAHWPPEQALPAAHC